MQFPRPALEHVVGQYSNDRLEVSVFLEQDALRAQVTGQPSVGLRAITSLQFTVEESDASLEFSAGDGPANTLTIRQNGRVATLTRMAK